MPFEVLFPEGRERFELGFSGGSGVVGSMPLAARQTATSPMMATFGRAARRSPDRLGCVLAACLDWSARSAISSDRLARYGPRRDVIERCGMPGSQGSGPGW